MKRPFLALPIALLAVGALVSPALAAKPDAGVIKPDVGKGQACADISPDSGSIADYRDANWTGVLPPASPTVRFSFVLTDPSCAPKHNGTTTTYTVEVFPVYGGVADTTPAVTQTYVGDGVTQNFGPDPLVLPTDSRGTAPDACVVVTSATGGHVIDTAPDVGCNAPGATLLLDDPSSIGNRIWH